MASSDSHDNHKQTTFRRPSKGRELALGTLPNAILPLNTDQTKTDTKSRRGSHNLVPNSHRRRSSLSISSSGGEGPSIHASLASAASKGPSKRIRGFEIPSTGQPGSRSGETTRRASRSSSHSHAHRDHRESSISGSDTSSTGGAVRSGHHRQNSRLLELVQNGTAKTVDPPVDDDGGEGDSSLKTSPPNALPGHVDGAKAGSTGAGSKVSHQSVMARVKNPGMPHARRVRRKSVTNVPGSTSTNPSRHASSVGDGTVTKTEKDSMNEKSEWGSRGPPKGYEMDRVTGNSTPYW